MHADAALDETIRHRLFPNSRLNGSANLLIFPNLDAGNAAYKVLAAAGGADVVGPMLLGMRKPVSVLQQNATVDSIVHITASTVAQSLRLKRGLMAVQPTPKLA